MFPELCTAERSARWRSRTALLASDPALGCGGRMPPPSPQPRTRTLTVALQPASAVIPPVPEVSPPAPEIGRPPPAIVIPSTRIALVLGGGAPRGSLRCDQGAPNSRRRISKAVTWQPSRMSGQGWPRYRNCAESWPRAKSGRVQRILHN